MPRSCWEGIYWAAGNVVLLGVRGIISSCKNSCLQGKTREANVIDQVNYSCDGRPSVIIVRALNSE